MRTILVTGATGAVGSALVPVLLRDPGAACILLIRARDGADLAGRLEDLFRFWGAEEGEAFRARVVAVPGDITEPGLGLDPAMAAELRARCTHIVHAAGVVRMNLPLQEARRCAVGSAAGIADLAWNCPRLEKVEFVSTVGVGGRKGGLLPETWIEEPRAFHNTYEQSKAEAEEAIRSHGDRGLPVTVHRPSMVVGHSRTGRILHPQIFHHLCAFLTGRRTLGLWPILREARLDTVPADHVAEAIAWSMGQASLGGQVLHLCAGPDDAIPLADLQVMVRSAMKASHRWVPPLVRLRPETFMAVLRVAGWIQGPRLRRALGTLPIFLDYLGTDQAFSRARTRALLAAGGLVQPDPREYLPVVIREDLAGRA